MSYSILVAGAGIAGLSATLALKRRGVAAQTFERCNDAPDAGLAINLPGNAIASLQELGLADACRAYGLPVRRREYRTDRGRLLFSMDEEAFWGEALTPRCMRRSDLAALLRSNIGDGAITRGITILSARDIDDGVSLVTSGGSMSCRLLVGADGVRSVVRRSIGGSVAPTSARLASASWRFMAPNPGIACWTLWASGDALLLLIPVDRGEVYGWASSTGEGGEESDLVGLFRRFPDPVRQAVEALHSGSRPLHHSPLEEVRSPAWTGRRTVLIGDAAHATAPVWAQGAALAMEDAIVLADLLASRADWGEVPREYERLRRPRIAHVQAMTDRMSRAARLPASVRNLILPFVGPQSYRATYGPLRIPSARS